MATTTQEIPDTLLSNISASNTSTAPMQPPPPSSPQTVATPLTGNDLDIIQDMIGISADRLEGLRTQCATSATLTQQEIRSLETKLVRMFSELLIAKGRLNERIPASGLPHTTGTELRQWLRVVGLSQASLNVCLTRLNTLEQLLDLQTDELKQLLSHNSSYREEEVRRLTKAMENLRKCKGALLSDECTAESKELLSTQLFWDSWDRHHPHHRGSASNTSSLNTSPRIHRTPVKVPPSNWRQSPSKNNDNSALTTDDETLSSITITTSPSLPNSPMTPNSAPNCDAASSVGIMKSNVFSTVPRRRASCTPPPLRRHQTLLSSSIPPTPLTPTHTGAPQKECTINTNSTVANSSPIQRYNCQKMMMMTMDANSSTITRSHHRLHIAASNSENFSPTFSEIFIENSNSLQVPRSPCTPIVPLGMGHTISHRFTKVFKMMSTCDLCQKQMFFGLKCKECKYRCHKDCEPNVPPSCGLPPEFVDEFKKTLHDHAVFSPITAAANISPNLNATQLRKNRAGIGAATAAAAATTTAAATRRALKNLTANTNAVIHYPDSSSPGSSCNSSSPSSPALFMLQQQQQQQQQPFHPQQHFYAASYCSNNFSSSAADSSSTSGGTISTMLPTPSSLQNHFSHFNFPDVTITSTFNLGNGGAASTTQTIFSSPLAAASGALGGAENVADDFSTSSGAANAQDNRDSSDNMFVEQSAAITTATLNASNNSKTLSLHSNCSNGASTYIATATQNDANGVANASSFFARELSTGGVEVDCRRSTSTTTTHHSELVDTHKSNDSDKTVSLSGSTSASTDSDRTPVRLDSAEDGDSGNWPRQNSISLKEWDIPYGDLRLLEKIGKGRFGTVHRALWHGDVAVKLLKEDYLDDEQTLEAFKLEVANFKKTRHENLVLFMGACMNPPYLAIVTSLCKGNTLYTYIHARRDKFTINRTTLVAQQISQGMGYLHARGIHHKDLRSKNIFLENGKVIITDFGLFSSTKLLYCDLGLGVPNGWLCYLAPELMRALLPRKPTDEILPFSKASDVYSFGTVWYELLCGEFPFKMQPPESTIWMVGRGMKQTLANLQTSRDIKDILMLCWSFQADDRPDFPKLLTLLERLPKKRLARSPSHPVQLSRSAESVF